jgi:hypothetical protein
LCLPRLAVAERMSGGGCGRRLGWYREDGLALRASPALSGEFLLDPQLRVARWTLNLDWHR